MLGCQVTPVLLAVVHDEAAVAKMGRCLTAMQAALLDEGGINLLFNFLLPNEVEESQFVGRPVLFVLPVGSQNVGRRSQHREVDVVDVADFLEEIPQVVALRESRELGHIVESNVDDALSAATPQQFEELRRALLRESNCVDGCG